MMTRQHIIRIVGGALGVLAGILILTIGFWRTLLLAVLAALGWFLTGSRKCPKPVSQALDRLFPKDGR